jgi:RHS repeat-associated protein
LKVEYSYDAWGRLRNPATQVAYTPGSEPALFLGRGYTGHEHLPWFGLVNMNARLYDPALGRFLSPDPYVQMPDFTQNFNRYSYCLNNPLVYIDQDGESFLLLAVIVGTIVGGLSGGFYSLSQNKSFWADGNVFKGAVIGAATALIGVGVGGAVSGSLGFGGFFGGAVSGAAGGGAAGFVGGAANAWWMQGANFGQGLAAGLIGGGIGLASGAIFGGFSRGIAAKKGGYDFWNGKNINTFNLNTDFAGDIDPNYNARNDTKYLKQRMLEEYGVSEGPMLKRISADGVNGYKVTTNGYYLDPKTNLVAGGLNVRLDDGRSLLHVAPNYVRGDLVAFRAVAGHELIHAYHNYNFVGAFNSLYSETIAHKYTYNVYLNYGYTNLASRQFEHMFQLGYWGWAPESYHIPLPF